MSLSNVKYPEKLPCPVILESGLRLGKNVPTSTLLLALCNQDKYEKGIADLSQVEREQEIARMKAIREMIGANNLAEKHRLYRMALIRWGADAQLLKTAEEASELSAAVVRNSLFHTNESEMAAEMADVEIMLEQARYNGLGPLIDHHKTLKLQRLAELLGAEYSPEEMPS